MEPNTTPVSVPEAAPVTPVSTPHTPQLEGPLATLKYAWNFFKTHWKALTPMVIAPSVVNYLGTLFMSTGNPFFLVITLILTMCSAVLYIVFVPALVDAVHRLDTDSAAVIDLKTQFRFGLHLFWPVVLLIIIALFASLGSFVLFAIPCIVYAIYAAFYSYVFVIDGKRGFSAFTESYSLVRGRWWAVLGRVLVLAAFSIVVTIIAGIIAKLLGSTAPVTGIINIISTAIVAPVAIAYSYRVYKGLKATRVPGDQGSSFKKWLIAFIVVGALSLVFVTIVAPIIIFKYGKEYDFSSLKYNQTTTSFDSSKIQQQIQDQINAELQRQAQNLPAGLKVTVPKVTTPTTPTAPAQ